MIDEPTTVKIPAWVKPLIPGIVAGVLSALGVGKLVEQDVASVRTGATNRTDAAAYEIQWLIGEVLELRSELKIIKEQVKP